jgi:hypothetical protein
LAQEAATSMGLEVPFIGLDGLFTIGSQ